MKTLAHHSTRIAIDEGQDQADYKVLISTSDKDIFVNDQQVWSRFGKQEYLSIYHPMQTFVHDHLQDGKEPYFATHNDGTKVWAPLIVSGMPCAIKFKLNSLRQTEFVEVWFELLAERNELGRWLTEQVKASHLDADEAERLMVEYTVSTDEMCNGIVDKNYRLYHSHDSRARAMWFIGFDPKNWQEQDFVECCALISNYRHSVMNHLFSLVNE